jgi:hypothetical protein
LFLNRDARRARDAAPCSLFLNRDTRRALVLRRSPLKERARMVKDWKGAVNKARGEREKENADLLNRAIG